MTARRLCANCSTPLAGEYCSSCGQRDDDPRGSVLRLARLVFSEWVGLDAKFPQTLWQLFSKPGLLTERYLDGQRVRYLKPLRLYTIASLLFVFLFSFSSPDASRWNVIIEGKQVGTATTESGNTLTLNYPDESGWLGEALAKQREKVLAMDPQEILDRFFKRLEETLPLALILFLPLLALAIKLFHPRRWLFDHFIFALHCQSFLFVVLIVPRFFSTFLALVAVCAVLSLTAAAYLALALRRVYRRSWPVTLATTAGLSLLYVALMLAVLATQMLWVILSL